MKMSNFVLTYTFIFIQNLFCLNFGKRPKPFTGAKSWPAYYWQEIAQLLNSETIFQSVTLYPLKTHWGTKTPSQRAIRPSSVSTESPDLLSSLA